MKCLLALCLLYSVSEAQSELVISDTLKTVLYMKMEPPDTTLVFVVSLELIDGRWIMVADSAYLVGYWYRRNLFHPDMTPFISADYRLIIYKPELWIRSRP